MATDESCYISRTERARRRTRCGMESQHGIATARNTMPKQERARKKDHKLSCWYLPPAKPSGERGPDDVVCSGQPPSTEHNSEGQKWIWGWHGSQWEWYKQNNQYIWLFTGLQSYILSARVGDSFYKNEAPCQHATI